MCDQGRHVDIKSVIECDRMRQIALNALNYFHDRRVRRYFARIPQVAPSGAADTAGDGRTATVYKGPLTPHVPANDIVRRGGGLASGHVLAVMAGVSPALPHHLGIVFAGMSPACLPRPAGANEKGFPRRGART